MELRHLRYLVTVADQKSMSAASRVLHVTQSAISEQLSNLEQEVGVPLLTRRSRNTVLTAEGEIFVQEARRTLASADRAVAMAQRAHRGEVGELRVSFFAGSVGVDFPKLIREFRKSAPAVRLSMIEMPPGQQWRALVDGTIDIAFTRRLEREYMPSVACEVLHKDPMMVILPRSHPAASGPVDLRDLAHEAFILSSREASPAVFDKFIELCSEAGFSPRIASICSVWSSVVLMVQAGEGISVLPVNRQQSRVADLAFCPLQSKNASVEFVMAWSSERDNNIMRMFRRLAVEHVGRYILKDRNGQS